MGVGGSHSAEGRGWSHGNPSGPFLHVLRNMTHPRRLHWNSSLAGCGRGVQTGKGWEGVHANPPCPLEKIRVEGGGTDGGRSQRDPLSDTVADWGFAVVRSREKGCPERNGTGGGGCQETPLGFCKIGNQLTSLFEEKSLKVLVHYKQGILEHLRETKS